METRKRGQTGQKRKLANRFDLKHSKWEMSGCWKKTEIKTSHAGQLNSKVRHAERDLTVVKKLAAAASVMKNLGSQCDPGHLAARPTGAGCQVIQA